MASEEQLILLLGRGQLPAHALLQALSLLALPLDWDLIVDRVLTEGVNPLFYRNLKALSRSRERGVSGSNERNGDRVLGVGCWAKR